MPSRILDGSTIRRLLTMPECIECMDQCLRQLAAGDCVQPLRSATFLPDRRGLVGSMPGFLAEPAVLGSKVVSVFPDNHGKGLDSHQGVVLLFDPNDGRLLAILDGSALTEVRTAAVSAVATRAFSRADSTVLAVIGSGQQARAHVEAIASVRPIERVQLSSRSAEHRAAFARWLRERFSFEVRDCSNAKDAVRDADIVCTVTSSPTPVVEGDWLAPGTHVNAVGACTPNARELDTAAVVRSTLFVDRRESAVNESGDYRLPLAEGAIGENAIVAELGDVLLGEHPGRMRADEITVFDSLGLAVEDLAAGWRVLERALEQGIGTELDLGGDES